MKAFDNSDWTLPDIITLIEGGNKKMLQWMEKKITRRESNEERGKVNNRRESMLSGSSEFKTDDEEIQYRSKFDAVCGSKGASLYHEALAKRVFHTCCTFDCSGKIK